MRVVTEYLTRLDPALAAAARRAYNCFEPYAEDVQEYARATALVPTSCEDEAVTVLRAMRANATSFREDGREGYFDAEQNALVARNAEHTTARWCAEGPRRGTCATITWSRRSTVSWSITAPMAKAIVWEHNTHIGDARFTDMARAGMVNVGQLVRESRGEADTVLVGFGTHRGTVIAADEWGAPMERMRVPRAQRQLRARSARRGGR